MNCRGFALITVLWLVAALSTASVVTIAAGRVRGAASANRILLTRAAWAREACVEMLHGRFGRDSTVREVDTVDLGRGAWCVANVADPGARLPLNQLDAASLRRLLLFHVAHSGASDERVDSLVDAVLDWRDADDEARPSGTESAWYRERRRRPPRNGPFADVRELRYVRGFDSDMVDEIAPLVTTRGAGRVNLNAAPPSVLAVLPMLDHTTLDRLLAARSAGRAFRDHAELADLAAAAGFPMGVEQFRSLVRFTTLDTRQLVVTVVGGVGGTGLVSRVMLTVVPVGSRLAVIRRETQ